MFTETIYIDLIFLTVQTKTSALKLQWVVPNQYQNHLQTLIHHGGKQNGPEKIPQVVLLTKVDLACPLVAGDLKKVYRSRYIKHQIEKASKILGIPVNCILPVKNYHEQISLNDETDVLALTSLLQILRFANDYLQNLYQQKYKTELQSIQ
uniref:Interferon-induced protein 44-like n=1 Tax=Lepisosteus oculatus TaxID=7918 RepID=W5LW60_LEPOC